MKRLIIKILVISFLCTITPAACQLKNEKTGKMQFDSFGGNLAYKGETTGFFHIEVIEGRHFFITPEGNGYRALGINHFHMMTSTDYDGAIEKIRNWGFNAGCYQGPNWMWNRYPYTKGINLVPVCWWMPDKTFGFKDVFDPVYLKEIEASVKNIVEPQKENQMLIGYFWTDIPIWQRKRDGLGWIEFYKTLPEESAGGKVWKEWKIKNPEANELDFTAVIARQLYARGYEYVRKYDQNHLIFGDRYHEPDMPDIVIKEALPYIDAISIQPTCKEFNVEFFDDVYKKYGRPIYIADHVSSYATAEHAITMGQVAKEPKAYMAYYERYVTAALSRPYMIGFNKCQYQDQMARGEMLKQGLINFDEEPYPVVGGIKNANLKALEHVYSGTEPEHMYDYKATLLISSPTDCEIYSAGSDIVISATADLQKMGGSRVSFYYMDEKWELIGHDYDAPFTATWRTPPPGNWTIYAAVHASDGAILDQAWINITVKSSSVTAEKEEP